VTDIFDVPDDGTYDGLPPPGCDPRRGEEERLRYLSRLHSVIDELTAAAGFGPPVEIASAASFVINSIRLYAFDRAGPRLRPEHRDELLKLLVRAKGNISRSLIWRNPSVDQRVIYAAIEAVACQIVFWAEPDPWKTRPSDLRADVCDRARWLQNELHNMCLETAISERQCARTVNAVDRIMSNALTGGKNVA